MYLIFNLLNNFIIFDDSNTHISQQSNFIYNYCYFSRTNNYNGPDSCCSGYYGYGGIIFCYNIESNMKLNNCVFFQCSSYMNGGAIYFHSAFINSNVEINFVCANNCFTRNGFNYQFGVFLIYNSILNKISLNYLSMNNCSHVSSGTTSIELNYGNISINNFNSTKNNNLQYSSFRLYSPKKSYSIFCTIKDNFVSNNNNFLLEESLNNIFLYFNIINNNSPNNYGVINIRNNANLIIEHCIFFKNLNYLFYLNSGELNIKDCKIFHDLNSLGIISTNNISFIETNTFYLIHLNTLLCNGNNDKIYSNSKFLFNQSFLKLIILYFL